MFRPLLLLLLLVISSLLVGGQGVPTLDETGIGCEWLNDVNPSSLAWFECLGSWQLRSSASDDIFSVSVPSTVLGALTDAGVYGPDPYHGLDIQNISAAPFEVPWRYQTNVTVPNSTAGLRTWLVFEGLSYKADVYINGQLVLVNSSSSSQKRATAGTCPGVCQPTTSKCSGSYASGLCPGSSDIKCCQEATPLCESPSQCQVTSLACDGYYEPGLCPGSSDVQCCRPPPASPSRQLVGTVPSFEVDVTSWMPPAGRTAVIEVEIDRPQDSWQDSSDDTDLALSFIDWAPAPADGSMGLWKPVSLVAAPGDEPFVVLQWPGVSVLSLTDELAVVEFVFDAWNLGSAPPSEQQNLVLVLTIDELPSWKWTGNVTLSSSQHSQLVASKVQIASPQRWWPWNLLPAGVDLPFLYTMRARLVSLPGTDLVFRFGLRTVSSQLNSRGDLQFYINDVPFVPLGAGGCPDLFLRARRSRVVAELALVRWMGLNAVRLEGKFPQAFFYAEADRLGIAVLPGFECCDAWQRWSLWGDDVLHVAEASLRSQAQQLRAHPSVLVFLVGSDEAPPANIEAAFRSVLAEERWPNTVLVSAANVTSQISGPSGVKMSGPYAWEPPIYWSDPQNQAHQLGGPFGFLTEGGPGAAPLTLDSWQRTVDPDDLWPADNQVVGDPYWDGHCGNPQGLFGTLKYFDPPLTARYGASTSAAEYLYKSQVAAYESHRVMFEEYSRAQVQASTGLIHWMLTSAYPSHMWRLYDWYLAAGGSFYAARKALSDPVHAMFRYADRSVWLYSNVAASLPTTDTVVDVRLQLINLDSSVVFANSSSVLFSPPATSAAMTVPKPGDLDAKLDDTYILRLSWQIAGVSFVNDYWLSSVSDDVLVWDATTFYQTPCSRFADMTQLQSLIGVVPGLTSSAVPLDNFTLAVTVTNPSSTVLAFAVEASLADQLTKQLILPQMWSDNYFNLLPGETRKLTVHTLTPIPSTFLLQVTSWNDLSASK